MTQDQFINGLGTILKSSFYMASYEIWVSACVLCVNLYLAFCW